MSIDTTQFLLFPALERRGEIGDAGDKKRGKRGNKGASSEVPACDADRYRFASSRAFVFLAFLSASEAIWAGFSFLSEVMVVIRGFRREKWRARGRKGGFKGHVTGVPRTQDEDAAQRGGGGNANSIFLLVSLESNVLCL